MAHRLTTEASRVITVANSLQTSARQASTTRTTASIVRAAVAVRWTERRQTAATWMQISLTLLTSTTIRFIMQQVRLWGRERIQLYVCVVRAMCGDTESLKLILNNTKISFFFLIFSSLSSLLSSRFHWHDNILKLCENYLPCPPQFSSLFASFFGWIQRTITRTIITITIIHWPTTTTSNGTFGNNSNGPINPNRTVGVSRRFCGLCCCCKKNWNVCYMFVTAETFCSFSFLSTRLTNFIPSHNL